MDLFLPAKKEELLDAKKEGLLVCPKYYDWNLPGAENRILLRRHVIRALLQAQKELPKHLAFLLWDGYRSLETQKYLYDDLFLRWKNHFSTLSDEEIKKKMIGYIAVPSSDPNFPSPHNTGCAIDLTLYDTSTQMPLEMGTDFDDFTERAHALYFDQNPPTSLAEEIAAHNRHLLYDSLLKHGFSPNEKEWWHFEYRS